MLRYLTLTFLIGLFSLTLGYGLSQPTTTLAGRAKSPPAALAPLGTGFTYQGYLSDGDAPAGGVYDFQFQLFDAVTTGNQISSTLTLADVPVAEGLFSVGLDFGASAFAGQARWLEIAVRPGDSNGAYTSLSPRQPLTAAPYALSLRPGATISGTASVSLLNLTNSSGSGLFVDSAGGDGMEVDSAVEDGVEVGSVGSDGVEVGSAGDDGIQVFSAGNPSMTTSSIESNGFEVAGAEGYGLYVGRSDRDGVSVHSTGDDGYDVNEAGDNGVEVAGAANLAGYFDGDVTVTGACNGCTLAAFGLNGSDQSLEPGAIVALTAALAPLEHLAGAPILMSVEPARAGEPVVGVVQGRAEIDAAEEEVDAEQPHLVPRDGAAAPGDYLTIIIYGLAQVPASAPNTPIAAGDRLAIHETGAARRLKRVEVNGIYLAEDAPTLGIALQGLAAGQDGLIWVLVNPQ